MICCERCGSSFSEIRAAEFGYCPRCLLREDKAVALHVNRFKQPNATRRFSSQTSASEPSPEACEGVGD